MSGNLPSNLTAIAVATIAVVAVGTFSRRKAEILLLPKDYQSKSAAEKRKILFGAVENEKGTTGQYAAAVRMLAWMLTGRASQEYVRDNDSDMRPKQNIGRLAKKIHSVGNVALAKYESIGDHDYTGIFKEGCPNTLVRLSHAVAPDATQTAPGMGVKFFRDGIKSANFVSMYKLSGQSANCTKDFGNFFANDFTNHVPELIPGESPSLDQLAAKFEEVWKPATMVGLSDISKYTNTGKEAEKMKFPFELVLKPNPVLVKQFEGIDPASPANDYLSKIPSGTKLYDIYARETPTSSVVLIGRLTTTSEMISSRFGDTELFFQHQSIADDWEIHPEWNVNNVEVWQAPKKSSCPFK